MQDTVTIIVKNKKGSSRDWKVVEGESARSFFNNLSTLNDDEKRTLLIESAIILSKCGDPNKIRNSITGLVIGYVQSGKTLSFTSLLSLAKDNGYRGAIILAGTKTNLRNQTTDRLKDDLRIKNSRSYKVIKGPELNNNDHLEIKRSLELKVKPFLIIPIMKNHSGIKKLTEILKQSDFDNAISGMPFLIIDDEADQASLNTLAKKNSRKRDWENDEYSTTFKSISNLRKCIDNHTYVQYTATPQAPLLIDQSSILSPSFHKVITPGINYTGGKTFFRDNSWLVLNIPDAEVYHRTRNPLDQMPNSLMDALLYYFIGSSIQINILNKLDLCSMMIHPGVENDSTDLFNNWVTNTIDHWLELLENENDPDEIEKKEYFIENCIQPIYKKSIKQINNPPDFDQILEEISEVIKDTKVTRVFKNLGSEIDWGSSSSHILIGGPKLDRGYTVNNLLITYMPRRTIGRSTADTIQQRCRFFGYKKDYLSSCRVFLPRASKYEYQEYVDHEEALRKALIKSNSIKEFSKRLLLDDTLNPTRLNILSGPILRNKMKGWRQFNALPNVGKEIPKANIELVEKFLNDNKFKLYEGLYSSKSDDRSHLFCLSEVDDVIDLISEFEFSNPSDSIRKNATIQYLSYLSKKDDLHQCAVFQMAYKNTTGRKRTFNAETMKINNIFSGPEQNRPEIYPGDKAIMIDELPTLQLHKIKLSNPDSQYHDTTIYTLGFYYPPYLEKTFVEVL